MPNGAQVAIADYPGQRGRDGLRWRFQRDPLA